MIASLRQAPVDSAGSGVRKPSVLILVRHYLPGHNSGGPARSVANIVDWLGDELDIKVITADRDAGDRRAYPGIVPGDWQDVGGARVLYLAPERSGLRRLMRILRDTEHDVLYLNSFFPRLTRQALLLRLLCRLPEKPAILAPRGDLAPGALGIKTLKKSAYLRTGNLVGLCDGLIWHASSEEERHEIERAIKGAQSVHVAPNLVERGLGRARSRDLRKDAGSAKIVFLSRVTAKKNLDLALRWLSGVTGRIELDIYGPLEDERYWRRCQALIDRLPGNVRAGYRGVVAHDQVIDVLARYHLFLLPTRGENFGHAIIEALSAGCPVLVGDQTPWRCLTEAKAGWDVPLSEPGRFVAAIDELVAMDQAIFDEWSGSARKHGGRRIEDREPLNATLRLFKEAAERGRARP